MEHESILFHVNVEVGLPVKQGLKRLSAVRLLRMEPVEVGLPVKQGLKQ